MKIRNIFLIIFCGLFIGSQYSILSALENGEDWLKRGIRESDYQEKVKFFEKAIELNPNLIDAHYRLGLAYRDIGELNKAERAFNAALRVSPDNVDNSVKLDIISELGMTYIKLRKHNYAKEALQYALNIAKTGERRCTILYELSKIYLNLEDYNKAISSLDEAINLNPKNLASFKAAIENARRLKELNINYKDGITSFQQGFYSEAVEAFANVVKIDPNFKDAADKLYQSQIRLSRLNDKLMATENINRAINDHSEPDQRKSSNTIVADNDMSSPVELSSNRRQARYQSTASTSGNNKYLDQLYEQGMSALRNDRWRTALKNFNKIQEVDPNYRDVSSLIMEARLGMESVQELEQVSKFYNQALEEFENGEWLKAIVEFEKAKMLYPGYKDIELKIAEAKNKLRELKRQGKIGEDVTIEEMMNKENSSNAHWALLGLVFPAILLPIAIAFLFVPSLRARFYLIQGKYKKASQLYEHILSKRPDNSKISVTLANIYLINDRRDNMALQVYQKALKNDVDHQTKEKITSIIAKEYLNRNIINQESIDVLTNALENEMQQLKK